MKKTVLFLFVALLFSALGYAQQPGKSPRITADGENVSVAYGQPSKRGRVIFGAEGSESLEKYGKVWRAGANECSVITFKKDGNFGGKAVKAGTYGLFAIPGEKEWVIILNNDAKQWGAYSYKADKDVVRVTVPAQKLAEAVEKLTFEIKENNLKFAWDTAAFSVSL